jgi:nicotinamide-nucleotide amidase
MSAAGTVVAALRARGWTLATAESLTAGRVAAAVADVPGCSDVLRGGVVAYQSDVKVELLDVLPADAVAGVVSRAVAEAMATGARHRVGADVGVSTTGVAGPDPHAGEPVGSVWIAVATPDDVVSEHLTLTGSRDAIRASTVQAVLELLVRVLGRSGE